MNLLCFMWLTISPVFCPVLDGGHKERGREVVQDKVQEVVWDQRRMGYPNVGPQVEAHFWTLESITFSTRSLARSRNRGRIVRMDR